MQDYGFKKLNFLTAGIPLSTGKGGYPEAFQILDNMKLDGMELEFVHGVRMSEESQDFVKKIRDEKNFVITAHAPFYINLNSLEPEKVDASVQRIVDTGLVASQAGAFSFTFHAAFYHNQDKAKVFNQVKNKVSEISEILKKSGTEIWIRPETTGKSTQWGDLDEIVNLSKEVENVLPCIDFSHLHARFGGTHNTYDEFSQMFEKLGTELGDYALNNFHGHLAGIEYGAKGEKKHLIFEDADMNYKDLLRAMKNFNIKGALVCESPNIELDTKLLKDFWKSL